MGDRPRCRIYRLEHVTSDELPPGKYVFPADDPRSTVRLELFKPVPRDSLAVAIRSVLRPRLLQ